MNPWSGLGLGSLFGSYHQGMVKHSSSESGCPDFSRWYYLVNSKPLVQERSASTPSSGVWALPPCNHFPSEDANSILRCLSTRKGCGSVSWWHRCQVLVPWCWCLLSWYIDQLSFLFQLSPSLQMVMFLPVVICSLAKTVELLIPSSDSYVDLLIWLLYAVATNCALGWLPCSTCWVHRWDRRCKCYLSSLRLYKLLLSSTGLQRCWFLLVT